MGKKAYKETAKRFGDTFMGPVGTIEGGDGTPVELNTLSASPSSIESRNATFGCPPGEVALLVEWLPSGLQHTPRKPGGGYPTETGVDASKIPHKDTWIEFPASFEGLPVYYKRGSQIWAM